MNFKRLLNSKLGVVFISIMLGLGLAVLFRKSCDGNNCIHFKGPKYNDIEGKTFQFGDSCYKYNSVSAKCDSNKQILEFSNTYKKEGMETVSPTNTVLETSTTVPMIPTATNSIVSDILPTFEPTIIPSSTPSTTPSTTPYSTVPPRSYVDIILSFFKNNF